MKKKYIFQSERLGFRNWLESDLALMSEINADKEVMKYFPKSPTEKETFNFIYRMQKQFVEKGFCYFAVDRLESKEFIGFIGISEQTYEAEFTPCIDIGWRLHRKHWGKGYATEGAKCCLEYAFNDLGLDKIYAIAPKVNAKSESVMKKIGLKKVMEFEHSLLMDVERLKVCVLYKCKK